MFHSFADWLATTSLSQALQDHAWVIPTSQSIHILAVSVVFASVLMINLRLLGIVTRGRSVSQLSNSLLPWIWRGLAVLLFTGIVQTVAEPVRQFVTPVFWAKMVMILIVVTMTTLYAKAVRRCESRRRRLDSALDRRGVLRPLDRIYDMRSLVCSR